MDQQQRLSIKEAKLKAAKYCAYQERSHKELKSKLYDYGLYTDEVEELLTELILEGFVNEERFARAYVGGKFRMKKWGRIKILMGLRQHDISEYCCKKGLEEINEDEYIEVLHSILEKKSDQIQDENLYVKRNKMARFAISRGFEPELTWSLIGEHFN